MWYRFAQILSDEEPKPGWQQEMEFKSGLSREKSLKNKMDSLLEKLPEEKRAEYQKEFDSFTYKNLNNYQDRVEYIDSLINNINRDITKQNTNSLNYIKSIVNKRITGKYINNEFDDADKIFKEYLDAKTNLNIFSNLKSSSDVMEIANFFLQNSTDPKLSIIKNILNKVQIDKWNKFGEISDLLLNFYLKTKLEQLRDLISRRDPLTSKDKLAIDFINSKIILHSMKIGININSLANKNIFGQLLGSIASTGTEGIEGLQNLLKTDAQIQSLLGSGN